MSWVRLDDRLAHHHKVRALAPKLALAAYGLYCAGICFAQAFKTDGRIRATDLSEVMPTAPPKQRHQCAAELVRVALWDVDPGGGWRIHDYLDHNASASERQSKARVAASARWHPQGTARSNAGSMPDACSGDASSSPLLSSPLHSTPLLSSPLHSTPLLSAPGPPDGFSATMETGGPEAMSALLDRQRILRRAKGYEP